MTLANALVPELRAPTWFLLLAEPFLFGKPLAKAGNAKLWVKVNFCDERL